MCISVCHMYICSFIMFCVGATCVCVLCANGYVYINVCLQLHCDVCIFICRILSLSMHKYNMHRHEWAEMSGMERKNRESTARDKKLLRKNVPSNLVFYDKTA
jgi:hypothetical protein